MCMLHCGTNNTCLLIMQDPWQLRQIFGDLEEGNLFLIQTAQVESEATCSQ